MNSKFFKKIKNQHIIFLKTQLHYGGFYRIRDCQKRTTSKGFFFRKFEQAGQFLPVFAKKSAAPFVFGTGTVPG